jgi:hypothetical protein
MLEAARQQAMLSVGWVWIAYVALGGTESLEQIRRFLLA